MVWRRSSWAAHYQSPLPASDTLFTEAPGADSPGRRQLTQGTALPSPHQPVPALLGFAAHWANSNQVARGRQPSHPLAAPNTQKSSLAGRDLGDLVHSPALEAPGLGRGL